MIVCIAEKPSVAEDIAKIIGATQRHWVGRNAGYYEGNGYQVTWINTRPTGKRGRCRHCR